MANKPEKQEINEVLNQCMEAEETGESRWRGMSYEQGVAAGIRWVLGETEDHPLED